MRICGRPKKRSKIGKPQRPFFISREGRSEAGKSALEEAEIRRWEPRRGWMAV